MGIWLCVLHVGEHALAQYRCFSPSRSEFWGLSAMLTWSLHYTIPLQVHLRSQISGIPCPEGQSLFPGSSAPLSSSLGLSRLPAHSLVSPRGASGSCLASVAVEWVCATGWGFLLMQVKLSLGAGIRLHWQAGDREHLSSSPGPLNTGPGLLVWMTLQVSRRNTFQVPTQNSP